MIQEDAKLSARCRELADLTAEASAWATDNRDTVRGEYNGLQRELRRAGRLFRTCAEAAARKMCVGVFGPSQAGKSYLISALARDDKGALMADFSGETHDFISEINPEGGKESTGLVTRFTTEHGNAAPAGYPVRVQLLSETDLVKILANTYYADCEHRNPPNPEAIHEALSKLEKLTGTGPVPQGATLDDLEDLREYLDKDFRGKARVQELERCFWTRALDMGPRLDLPARIRLYALLWDEVAPFTALLGLLLEALHGLGCPAQAFAPMSALIPRDASIIDVALLKGLGGVASADTLELTTAAGTRSTLPRSVVTALTAELTIVMHQSPDPLFNYTDLLDFPGYRSRFQLDDVRRELEKPDILKDLFLRGKVAYLFQRYCARRELTSMLLCIGPSNQEVQDLPGVINEWVTATHGKTPERRADKKSALYFVLSKFDMEFEQKKGAPSVETRWDTRLHTSLLDFFGKQHDWPRLWNGSHAFNNLFLLRNPNFRFDAVLSYDQNGLEQGVRPDQQNYVNALESAFMHSALVKEHFENPRESWDAAMRLNDGGISLIREKLQPLCDPAIKRAQISTNLAEQQELLLNRLKPFWKSDDREELRARKTELFDELLQHLAVIIDGQIFGEFLFSLGLQDQDLVKLYREAERQAMQSGATANMSASPRVSISALLKHVRGSEAPAPQKCHKDAAAVYAELIEGHWLQLLHALADDPALQARYALPGKAFADLVNEFTLAAERLRLRETLEEKLRLASNYANMDRDRLLWKQASLAASHYNAFVTWLGMNPRELTAAERTTHVDGQSIVLFDPPPPVNGVPQLDTQPTAQETRWCGDWLLALMRLIMDNVNFDGEQNINVEQNTRVGHIIRGMAPQQDSAQ